MIIVMLGAPGSGKGTAAKLLSEVIKAKHISTGDMFREVVEKKGPLAEELESYMTKGLLVPDELVIRLLEEELTKPEAKNGVILDGFPRNEIQAVFLNERLKIQGKKVDLALRLNVSDEEIIYRTAKRRICSNSNCGAIYNLEFKKPKVEGICDICGSNLCQRKDDNRDTITQRLKVYQKKSREIIDYFDREGLLYTIDLKANNDISKEQVAGWLKSYEEVKSKGSI